MKKNCIQLALIALLVSGLSCVGTSKSSNPLSPTVAGPIAGVGISPPTVMAPAIDAMVDTSLQPITLRVGNAQTSGVRPLSYRFEVATDPGFTNQVVARDAVPQDPSGSTSLVLPTALAPERKYFWRARAEDGANTGPFGATSAFSVFTPVVFGPPALLAPINGVTTSNSQPQFIVGNAPRTGPAGFVAYLIEITNAAGQIVAGYAFPETPGQSGLTIPTGLPIGQYFWRARAYDPGFTGPFSAVQSFRSPGTTGGGGGNPGKPCGPPYPTAPLDILNCRRSQYPGDMSAADRVAFLIGSAKDMNAAGVPGGPFGILRKASGNNCGGYSCDILCTGQGNAQLQYDVLISEQIPTWGPPHGVPGIRIDVCEIQ